MLSAKQLPNLEKGFLSTMRNIYSCEVLLKRCSTSSYRFHCFHVSKEAGEKWMSMTDEKKKPYLDRFIKVKVEYEKAMEIYNAIEKKELESRKSHYNLYKGYFTYAINC
ncbi:hypothetical protein P8452_25862 [Trifolium repens]|nr:hypothetical protein P8452_25862 [Trifolium repens]